MLGVCADHAALYVYVYVCVCMCYTYILALLSKIAQANCISQSCNTTYKRYMSASTPEWISIISVLQICIWLFQLSFC